VPQQQIQRILRKAKARGYQLGEDQRILERFVKDGARSGRPKEISQEIEQAVLTAVQKDRNDGENISKVIGYEVGISSSSVLRILSRHDFTSVKPTQKPGLTKAQQQARYNFCKRYKDWTLEDWKNVV
jgi:transposase